MAKRGESVLDLIEVMDRLRSPGGCPWDARQTHESLVEYLVEEAYEAVEAIDLVRESSNRTLAAPTIVLNRMRSTVAEHRHRAQELRAYFDRQVSDVEIPERNAIAQAGGAGMPIHAWDSPAGRELSERFDTLLDRLFPGGMR